MRWVWRAEDGGFKIEYAALVILVATLVTAVAAFGLPTDVRVMYAAALCRINPEAEGCEGDGTSSAQGFDPAQDGDSESGPEDGEGMGDGPADSDPNGEDGPEDEDTSGDTDVSEGGFDPYLLQDAVDANSELTAAESAKDDAEADYDAIFDDLLDIVADIVGLTDAKDCLLEGDLVACLWTVVGLSPWGKGAKLAKAVPKIARLWSRFRKLKKTRDTTLKNYTDAKKKFETAISLCNKGKRPRNSFVAGTPVLLADGSQRAIEDVGLGAGVWATDPGEGRTEERPVLRSISSAGQKDLVDIRVLTPEGGDTVTATAEHPFWVEGQGWVDAGDLRPRDSLIAVNGAPVTVSGVRRHSQWSEVHNLSIGGIHTYYIVVSGSSLLVHNDNPIYESGGKCGEVKQGKNIRNHYKAHKDILGKYLGKKYPMPKKNHDYSEFLNDIAELIASDKMKYEGMGTLKKEEPEAHIYRGEGMTVVITADGKWQTLLKSGEGMDKGINITKKPRN